MDLVRLRVLVAIAREGSITGAAEALHYAQPSVSHHLARLEAEVGVPLVQRAGRGIRLTDAGRLLADRAEEILGRVSAAQAELDAHAGLRAGRLRLAAFPSALATLVPPAAALFAESHPEIELSLREAEPPEALAALRRGDVDLALIFRYETSEPDPPPPTTATPQRDELETPLHTTADTPPTEPESQLRNKAVPLLAESDPPLRPPLTGPEAPPQNKALPLVRDSDTPRGTTATTPPADPEAHSTAAAQPGKPDTQPRSTGTSAHESDAPLSTATATPLGEPKALQHTTAATRPGDPETQLRSRGAPLVRDSDTPLHVTTVPLLREPIYLVISAAQPPPGRAGLAGYRDARWIAGCPSCRTHLLAQCATAGHRHPPNAPSQAEVAPEAGPDINAAVANPVTSRPGPSAPPRSTSLATQSSASGHPAQTSPAPQTALGVDTATAPAQVADHPTRDKPAPQAAPATDDATTRQDPASGQPEQTNTAPKTTPDTATTSAQPQATAQPTQTTATPRAACAIDDAVTRRGSVRGRPGTPEEGVAGTGFEGGGDSGALVAGEVGFVPEIAFETDDYVAAQALVAAGMGVTTLSGLPLVAHRNSGVRVTRLPGDVRVVMAATYGKPPAPLPVQSFLAALAEVTAATPPWPDVIEPGEEGAPMPT